MFLFCISIKFFECQRRKSRKDERTKKPSFPAVHCKIVHHERKIMDIHINKQEEERFIIKTKQDLIKCWMRRKRHKNFLFLWEKPLILSVFTLRNHLCDRNFPFQSTTKHMLPGGISFDMDFLNLFLLFLMNDCSTWKTTQPTQNLKHS